MEVMAVAMEVDVAAAVLGTVGAVEGVVRVEEVVAETVEVNKVAELLVAEEGMEREVGGGQVEATPKATASHPA